MSHNRQKKIAVINDFCGFGRCSIAASLPVISAMKIQCCPLPTSIFSNHTGFDSFYYTDFTGHMDAYMDEWAKLDLHFNGILTGFLGSPEQVDIVRRFLERFKRTDTVTVIDPVMGDYGKLYPGFTEEFATEMAKLCGKADLILPNMTEVAYMLGIDYVDSGYDEAYVKDLLKKLCGLGAKIAAITGISFEPGQLGVMSYNSETGEYFKYFNKEANGKYHGTGDVFASCCTGALMNGLSTDAALSLAADYTARCIQNTLDDKDGRWYGVNFESEIPYLVKRLEDMK